MIRIARPLLLIAAVLFAGSALAGARDSLDRFTSGLKGLEGQFTQHVYDTNGRQRETSSGRVALSAPRLFRWEYVNPYPQLIVADGSRVWIYDPDLEQVTVRVQGEDERDSPLAALFDPARLDREFVVDEEGASDGLDWLAVAPRTPDESGFQNARLGFDGGVLARMDVVDALGQRTSVVFSDWKKNPTFAPGTFRYSPPEGVDVIGDI